VQRVEVSFDDAATWAAAVLEAPLNQPFTWVRWAFPFEAVTGSMKMSIRVTDGQGQIMDETDRAPLPDGATGWPSRKFTVE
jgi:sulfite oxidase